MGQVAVNLDDERFPPRLWSKVVVSDGHWLWTGTIAGCPQIRWKVDGVFKTVSVRRLLFEAATGTTAPAIGGCRVDCVNPAHAIGATHEELARRWNAAQDRTRCKHGHLLAEVGVYLRIVEGRTVRSCRRCWLDRSKAQAEAKFVRNMRRASPARRRELTRRRAGGVKAWVTRRAREAMLR